MMTTRQRKGGAKRSMKCALLSCALILAVVALNSLAPSRPPQPVGAQGKIELMSATLKRKKFRAVAYVESKEELEYRQAHAAELAQRSEKDLLASRKRSAYYLHLSTNDTKEDDTKRKRRRSPEEEQRAILVKENSLPLIYTTDTILKRMLQAGALAWVQPSEPPNAFSNVDIVEGNLAIVPEKPKHGVPTDEHIDAVHSQSTGCSSSSSIRVAMCAMVRNRAKLTVEWLQWHRILGVEHFFIYDDESDDMLKLYLDPLVKRGIVTLSDAAGILAKRARNESTIGNGSDTQKKQKFFAFGHKVGGPLIVLYEHCMRQWNAFGKAAKTTSSSEERRWIGIIDPDEFGILQRGVCMTDFIQQVVQNGATRPPDGAAAIPNAQLRSKTVAAISIPWLTVGHVGELHDHSTRSQLEKTQFARGAMDGFAELFKSLIDVTEIDAVISHMESAHYAHMKTPERHVTVFSDGQIVVPNAPKGDGVMFMNTSHLTDANLPNLWVQQQKHRHHQQQQPSYPCAALVHYYCRSFASFLQRKLDGYSDVDATKNVVAVDELYSYWYKKFFHLGFDKGKYTAETLGERHDLLLKSLGY